MQVPGGEAVPREAVLVPDGDHATAGSDAMPDLIYWAGSHPSLRGILPRPPSCADASGPLAPLLERKREIEYDSGDMSQLRATLTSGSLGSPSALSSIREAETPTLSPDGTPAVSPYTSHLVISNRQRFPVNVCQRMAFLNPDNANSLVTEFEYGRTSGDIFYDIKSRDEVDADGYARLVTLNWWYQALSACILNGALVMIDISSNIMFCVNILTHVVALRVPMETAWLFVCVYICLEIGAVGLAYRHVAREWHNMRKHSPDLITDIDLNIIDADHAFYASVFFYFLNMDTLVRDIIIWLHPFKSVQPYCAMKCDGHRCYLLGFASEYQFRVDSMVGQEINMTVQGATRVAILSFKFYIALYSCDLMSASLCVPSFALVILRTKSIIQLISDREQLWEWLNQQHLRLEKLSKDEEAMSEPDQRLVQALEKQKETHFGECDWGGKFQGYAVFRRNLLLAAILIAILWLLFGADWALLHRKT